MNLLYLDFFNIGKTVENFFRGIFWGAIRVLMGFITGMMEALTKGIMGFPILQNTYIKEAYTASLAIMLLVIAPKIIYEIVICFVKDDEAGLDYGKKIGGAVLGIFIAVTLSITIPIFNNLTVNITNSLTTTARVSSETTVEIQKICKNKKKYLWSNLSDTVLGGSCEQRELDKRTDGMLGNSLLSSVFVGFGGMEQKGDFGADNLVNTYKSSDFDIYNRDDGDYVWDFSELMVMIGMIIYIILLFMISVQVATRIMAIGFYYVIGPICCLSLTNYQNPQAFTVWKNSLIGQFLLNVTQIFLLGFFSSIVGDIGDIASTTGLVGTVVIVAQLILYFAGFSIILTMPSFVQSMIGGYGAGIMDTVNQIRGGLSMGKAMTVGAVSAGVAKTVGKRSSYTGHREGGIRGAMAGNKRNGGTRSGGILGNLAGNKNKTGTREGGIRGAFAGDRSSEGNLQGGLRGAFAGNVKSHSSGATRRSGGVVGALRGSKETLRQSATGASTTTYSGGARGIFKGTTTVQRNDSGKVTSKKSERRANPFRKGGN